MGDEEEQAELERAIALSLANNGVAVHKAGSPSALCGPLEHGNENGLSQESQPSPQGEEPVAGGTASTPSHEAMPPAGRASAGDATLESDPIMKEDEADGQPGGTSSSGRELHAEDLIHSSAEAASPPEPSGAGPSRICREHGTSIQNVLPLDQPSTSGACQGVWATLDLYICAAQKF